MKLVQVPYPNYMDKEIVERKAIGHPDSLCDGIAEEVSRALSKVYLKETGTIQHHNVDKVALVAGQSKTAWGGGEVTQPIKIIIAGRANYSISVPTVAIKAAREYLRKIIPLAQDEHFIIEPMIGVGASELITTAENIVANDTSFGVSFAPFTDTEQVTLDMADFLTSDKLNQDFPSVGKDIKVMSHKDGTNLDTTVAIAFIDKYLQNANEYKENKESLTRLLKDKFGVDNLMINTLDKYDSKDLLYLTVTGTSAEHGDDGATGRGNRVNGLITPGRPMSLEAACGKNPVSHVGKIYNVMAHEMAKRIYADTNKPAEVMIQSRIGHPVTNPPMVLIRCDAQNLESIVKDELAKLPEVTKGFVEGRFRLF
ncbi:MAG: methionine adenosyltransferase [Candidatus Altiarchaeota archaeon]|nr:methionine adenosyltransferase [Candidatus Altiarchaeota archaeon]